MALDLERENAIGGIYAAALFELARDAGRVEPVRDELAELARVAEQSVEFRTYITSVAIGIDERAASLERMFRGRLSDVVLNTLQVLNRKGRLGSLAGLHRAYVAQCEAASGQVKVQATSAVELSVAQRGEVTRLAEGLSGRQPLVEFVVDPQVIGGLVLRIGDYRLDNSIRRHLSVARTRLLGRSVRPSAGERSGAGGT
jgi:F-type H+-transporting ATPase subunit delta